jgi:hypothetical protein
MCPGVDSASKNEYQDIPGGKGDDLTTFMCRMSRNSGALTYQNPKGHKACSGITLPYKLFTILLIFVPFFSFSR